MASPSLKVVDYVQEDRSILITDLELTTCPYQISAVFLLFLCQRRCACRKPSPRRSGCMFVFVQGSAEAVGSSDVEAD